jgi:hypothetical protein
MFVRRSSRVERIIVLLLRNLSILGYFYMRFYIGGGITVFRILLNLGYSWEVFNGCRGLSR